MVSTLTPVDCLISLARSYNNSALLAVKTRLYPSDANLFAISKPMPDEAPVINAYSFFISIYYQLVEF